MKLPGASVQPIQNDISNFWSLQPVVLEAEEWTFTLAGGSYNWQGAQP